MTSEPSLVTPSPDRSGALLDDQAAMGATEERQRLILEALHDGIVIQDDSGAITSFNGRATEILGLSDEQLLGRTSVDLAYRTIREDGNEFPGEQHPAMVSLRTGQPTRDVVMGIRRSASEVRWIKINSEPLLRTGGATPYAVVTSFADVTEERAARGALRTSEERYRQIFDNVLDGVFLLEVTDDGHFRNLAVNPAFETLTGMTGAELIGKTMEEAVPAETAEIVNAKYRRCVEEGRPTDEEVELDLPSGRRTYHSTLIPARDDSGRIHRIVGITRDITERINAQAQVAKLAAIVESSHDAIGSATLDGTITSWNPGAEHIYGYRADEAVGRSMEMLAEPDQSGEIHEVLERVCRGEVIDQQETTRRRKDGTTIEVSLDISPLRDVTGAIVGLSVIARDITERKRAEKERSRLVAAVEQTADIVVIADREGRIVYANGAFENATGHSRDEIVAMPPEQTARILGTSINDPELLSALRAGRPWAGTVVTHRRDGSTLEAEVVVSVIRDERDSPIGAVGLGRDVTGERRLEEQLRHSQKMDAVGRLAGGVAHDFNNLLTVIRGFSELLSGKIPRDNGAGHADLEQVISAADRAAVLVKQLLVFSRRQVVKPQIVAPAQVIEEIVPMLRRLIAEHIELVTLADPDSGRVSVDPGQLEQVVVNLAVNARDAMPGGGRLTIETATVDLETEFVQTRTEVSRGPYVRLTVADTGAGMDAETQARIFEPFFTTKAPGAGTGLGLATVYGIVKQAGGTIYVYSEPGRGTTFRIYLPRVDEPADVVDVVPVMSAPTGSETVMVVEDEAGVREFARRVLSEYGYRVLDARSGAEALDLAARHDGDIDLLLTDIVMAGMLGPELTGYLTEARPDLRVLYMSGFDSSQIGGAEILADAATLSKPFTTLELGNAVRSALDTGLPGSMRAESGQLRDIAALAGVSPTEASAILRGHADPSIADATRRRVLGASNALAYRPSSLTVGRRGQASDIIGFVSDVIAATPFAGRMIHGAQDVARAAGRVVAIIETSGDLTIEARAFHELTERRVDALIYATMYHRIVEPRLANIEIPTVLLDCRSVDRTLSSVVPDEFGGAYTAVERLIAAGHREIGYVQNVERTPATAGRMEGYRRALEDHGVVFDPSLVVTAASDIRGGEEAADELVGRGDRPTALFCFNDRLAMGAYRAARRVGIDIPTQLSIVGFDNQDLLAPLFDPPLTTIQMPHYEMGRWAMKHLLAVLAGEVDAPVQHVMPCPLVERESVSPPERGRRAQRRRGRTSHDVKASGGSD
jgi:two-component system cell cycle sensor histidine kinase/response regulator CckA